MILVAALVLSSRPLQPVADWTAPQSLPFARVHSIAKMGSRYLVGGLKGLAQGNPDRWQQIDERPVRDGAASEGSLWVLFGDGSVDKLEPSANRLVFDALKGA